jgi:hypothetical protein
MAYTQRLSEQLALVSTIDPEAYTTAATVTGDVVDMDTAHRVVFVLMLGTVAANTTVDMDIQQGTTTTTATSTVTSITQLVAADDDVQVIVDIPSEAMADGARYLFPVVTIGGTGGTVDLSMVGFADCARYKPASALHPDLASVDEIVNA